MDCKSTNLLSEGKELFKIVLSKLNCIIYLLIKDENDLYETYLKKDENLELFSFILTKQLEKVIENIIRNLNNGKLEPLKNPILPLEIEDSFQRELELVTKKAVDI